MSSRIDFTLKNARWTIIFSVLLLLLNFFSRSVFIDYLGSELVGLTSVITSYVGFLNLAELGIGMAITQALYKPVFEEDRTKIAEIVSLIGLLFRGVGIFILLAGVVLACFLPTIFQNSGIDLTYIYVAFGAMLFTTLLSYWANYKQVIVVATQRSYVITKIQNSVMVVKVGLQMATLLWFGGGYIWWLIIEMVFGVVYALWLEIYIKRNFAWLKTSIKMGREVAKREKSIFKNVKNIFSQRLASMILMQSDNIVIQNVISVVQVAYFTNYTMLIQRVTSLIVNTLGNAHASVGNLIHSNDKSKMRLVFWQLNALFFWVAGVVAFGFYELVNPFIDLWLTQKELYSQLIVLLLGFNLFISIIRRPIEYFLNGYGLFADVWAAWSEMGLNLALSIVLAIQYGVIGVVVGTAISTGLSVFIWKPYYLYSRGFKRDNGLLKEYWITTLKFVFTVGLVGYSVDYMSNIISFQTDSWLGLIVKSVVVCGVYAVVSFGVMWATSSGMKTVAKLGVDIIKKRFAK